MAGAADGVQQSIVLHVARPDLDHIRVFDHMRMLGYAAFNRLSFEPVVETDGDCHARSKVRFRELFQSIDLIRQAIAGLPAGDIKAKVKGRPNGETVSRAYLPRAPYRP